MMHIYIIIMGSLNVHNVDSSFYNVVVIDLDLLKLVPGRVLISLIKVNYLRIFVSTDEMIMYMY